MKALLAPKVLEKPFMKNALIIWTVSIPLYIVGILLSYLFYQRGHFWRSRSVLVGYCYEYTRRAREPDDTQEHGEDVELQSITSQAEESEEMPEWHRNFKGHWVVHNTD